MEKKERPSLERKVFYPKTQGTAIDLIGRLEKSGSCLTSTRLNGDVIKYSLWGDLKTGTEPIVNRLAEFNKNNCGLLAIPRGDQVKLREAVARDVATSTKVLELEMDIDRGQLPAGCSFGAAGKDSDGYVADLVFDFEDKSGQKLNGSFEEGTELQGLKIKQLEVFLAACRCNIERWRNNGCKDELSEHVPDVTFLTDVRFDNIEVGVKVMAKNDLFELKS